MGSENQHIYKAPQEILIHNQVWEATISWGNQPGRKRRWPLLEKVTGLRILPRKVMVKGERFQSMVLVNTVAESKLRGIKGQKEGRIIIMRLREIQ